MIPTPRYWTVVEFEVSVSNFLAMLRWILDTGVVDRGVVNLQSNVPAREQTTAIWESNHVVISMLGPASPVHAWKHPQRMAFADPDDAVMCKMRFS